MIAATIAPDFARFSRYPMDGPKAALLSLFLGYSLILICAGLPSIVTGTKNITVTLVELGLGTGLAILGIMDDLIVFLIVPGILIPPIAGIYLTHYLGNTIFQYQNNATASVAINFLAFINWALGPLMAYLSLEDIITLTGIPSCDAIFVASGGYFLTRYVVQKFA